MKTDTNQPLYLTRKQVQLRYQVSHDTIHEWVKAGRLPAPHKLGERVARWKLDDLEAFEQRCAQ